MPMHQDPLLVCVIGTVFTADSSDWRRSETEIDDGKRAQVFVKMAATADGAVDASDGNTERYTFISGDDSPFCQWHPSDFTVDGIKYNCAEQFMMHQKAGNYGVLLPISQQGAPECCRCWRKCEVNITLVFYHTRWKENWIL